MEMFYATLRDFPRRVANRVQTIKMAEALSRLFNVTMSVSKLHLSREELFIHYGVSTPFSIVELGESRIRPITIWRFPHLIKAIRKTDPDFIFVREEYPAFLLTFLYDNVVYEMHDFAVGREWVYRGILGRSLVTVVITRHLEKRCLETKRRPKRLLVLPDGVDLGNFKGSSDPTEAKRDLGLPLDKKVVLYAGRLSRWKGIYTLIESARYLPLHFNIVMIGGFEGEEASVMDFIRSKGLAHKIQLLGFKPHAKVPCFMRAADVLVLPNSAEDDISKYFTSPLKMFEYMASGRPVVASDVPSIREVLSEKMALLSPPDDPKALARAIIRAATDTQAMKPRIANCLEKVGEYSWDARARKLAMLLKQCISPSTALSHDRPEVSTEK